MLFAFAALHLMRIDLKTIPRAQDENAGLEAALGAARAQLRELEGAYDLAAAADSLNAAARAAAEEEVAAARCQSHSPLPAAARWDVTVFGMWA